MVQLDGAWQPADSDAVVHDWIRQGVVSPTTLIRHSSWAAPRAMREVPVFWEYGARLHSHAAVAVAHSDAQRAAWDAWARRQHAAQKAAAWKTAVTIWGAVGFVATLVLFFVLRRSVGGAWTLLLLPIGAMGVLLVGQGAKVRGFAAVTGSLRKRWKPVVYCVAITTLSSGFALLSVRSDHQTCERSMTSLRASRDGIPAAPEDTPSQWASLQTSIEESRRRCAVVGTAYESELDTMYANAASRLSEVQSREAAKADVERQQAAERAAAAEKQRIADIEAAFPGKVADLDKRLAKVDTLFIKRDFTGASEELKAAEAQLDEAAPTAASSGADYRRLKKRASAQRDKLKPKLEAIEKKAEDERQKAELYSAICGERPNPSAWDGSIYAVTRAVKEYAHDPDSIEVTECAVPKLSADSCWVTVCKVRGKNAFGATILNVKGFSISTLGAAELPVE
ncbi:MAG: hypothetical protein HOW73_18105 [Polyangiaceae bacterium]|nr:hypothetical protein [Polyangiaceae bacterium]